MNNIFFSQKTSKFNPIKRLLKTSALIALCFVILCNSADKKQQAKQAAQYAQSAQAHQLAEKQKQDSLAAVQKGIDERYTLPSKDQKVSSGEQTNKKILLHYSILEEEVFDKPIKTQVKIKILISGTRITEQKIRELLTYLYEKTIKRTGFTYHPNPTNIFIYAFTTKEKANSGTQWVGMISKSYSDTQPSINISSTQINSLTLKPVEKFGLSESVRLEIWKEDIKLVHRAQKEADIKYPEDRPNMTLEDLQKNSDLWFELCSKYRKELFVKYRIDWDILDSIQTEGEKKGWTLPQ